MKPHEIACHQAQAEHAEIIIKLEPELFWFCGHFASQPILPGVAQLDWVMHYATLLLAPEYRFHSIQAVKFQAPLLPETVLTLVLDWRAEKELLCFSFQRHDGELHHTCSSGKIRLCR